MVEARLHTAAGLTAPCSAATASPRSLPALEGWSWMLSTAGKRHGRRLLQSSADLERPSLVWGASLAPLGLNCILYRGQEDADRGLSVPRPAMPTPEVCAQRGIPELPGSPAAPGFMLFHNVFWETMAVF